MVDQLLFYRILLLDDIPSTWHSFFIFKILFTFLIQIMDERNEIVIAKSLLSSDSNTRVVLGACITAVLTCNALTILASASTLLRYLLQIPFHLAHFLLLQSCKAVSIVASLPNHLKEGL